MMEETPINSPTSFPKPRQVEEAYVTLKTIRDFGHGKLGVSYSEIAKHLFISKQLGFEMRVPFDYPSKFPTSPGGELRKKLEGYCNCRLVEKHVRTGATYYRVTENGLTILKVLENALRGESTPDSNRLESLASLHELERWKSRNRDESAGSLETLQQNVVRPLMLNLVQDVELVFVDQSLGLLKKSDLIVPIQAQLNVADLERASAAAIRCQVPWQASTGNGNSNTATKVEIFDFVKKLMYAIEEFKNNGFLGCKGELVLLYTPLCSERREVGTSTQIYTAGATYKREITVRSDAPLNINVGYFREFFILGYVTSPSTALALAIGVPRGFYDELTRRGIDQRSYDDYQKETLERIFQTIRPHLNLWKRSAALRKLYDSLRIDERTETLEAIARLMSWAKKFISIRSIHQIRIDDPYPELENLIEGKSRACFVDNCKEFVALLAILLICLPILERPSLFVQFCAVRGGNLHVRIGVKIESENALIPLDLDFVPVIEVLSTYRIGGKRI